MKTQLLHLLIPAATAAAAFAAPGDYLFEREMAGTPRWPKQFLTPEAGKVLGWSGTGAGGSLVNMDFSSLLSGYANKGGANVFDGSSNTFSTSLYLNGSANFGSTGAVVFHGETYAFTGGSLAALKSAMNVPSGTGTASGTNTGDQNLSALALKSELADKTDDLAGVQNINANFTLADSHLGKLLIVTGNRTMTLPFSGVRPGRFAVYVNSASQLTVDGLLLDGSGGVGESAFQMDDGYVEFQFVGSYWTAVRMKTSAITEITGTMAQFDTAVTDGNLVYQNQPISPTAITETVVPWGTVTTGATLTVANGTVLTATLTASTACSFTMPAAVAGKRFTLYLKQAATTGNGTATFTGVKWPGSAPVITATAGRMDILTFCSDGTNWYGSAIQNYIP